MIKTLKEALIAAYLAGNQRGHETTVEGYWTDDPIDIVNEWIKEHPEYSEPDNLKDSDFTSVLEAQAWRSGFRSGLAAHSVAVGEVRDMKYDKVSFYYTERHTLSGYLQPGTKLYVALSLETERDDK